MHPHLSLRALTLEKASGLVEWRYGETHGARDGCLWPADLRLSVQQCWRNRFLPTVTGVSLEVDPPHVEPWGDGSSGQELD